jgi:hypothetical protein
VKRIIYFNAERQARDSEPPGKRFRVVVGGEGTPHIEVETRDAAGDASWRRAAGFSHDDVSRVLGRAISTHDSAKPMGVQIDLGALPKGVLL